MATDNLLSVAIVTLKAQEKIIDMNHLLHLLNLLRTDIDPEVFANALVVQHVSGLINSGGGSIGRPYLESVLQPQQLEVFLARAVETAQKTKHLEHEWRELHQAFCERTSGL